jgi:hypothetical protein
MRVDKHRLTSFRPARVRREAEQACSRTDGDRTDRVSPRAAVHGIAGDEGNDDCQRRVRHPPSRLRAEMPSLSEPVCSPRLLSLPWRSGSRKPSSEPTSGPQGRTHPKDREGDRHRGQGRKEGEVAQRKGRVKRARCFCRALRACGRRSPLARRGHQANAALLATSLPLRARGDEEGLHRTSNTAGGLKDRQRERSLRMCVPLCASALPVISAADQ